MFLYTVIKNTLRSFRLLHGEGDTFLNRIHRKHPNRNDLTDFEHL